MSGGLHWASPYVGKPWVPGAQGPDAFNCWGLVRWIQRLHFSRQMPEIPVDENDVAAITGGMRTMIKRIGWRRVPTPRDGDIAVMRSATDPLHVGVWLDADGGGILHSVRGVGVIFTGLGIMQLCGWLQVEFYRCAR